MADETKPTDESTPLDEGIVWEDATTDSEYIAACYNALGAIDDLDTAMMSKAAESAVKRIRRRSLAIIDKCIDNLYSELFETDENDD
ncbi:MAG: hypothetical protein [Bacteriophage sp.]|nr:MAG: hypothetical protein [Bacteriophage sp.]